MCFPFLLYQLLKEAVEGGIQVSCFPPRMSGEACRIELRVAVSQRNRSAVCAKTLFFMSFPSNGFVSFQGVINYNGDYKVDLNPIHYHNLKSEQVMRLYG